MRISFRDRKDKWKFNCHEAGLQAVAAENRKVLVSKSRVLKLLMGMEINSMHRDTLGTLNAENERS